MPASLGAALKSGSWLNLLRSSSSASISPLVGVTWKREFCARMLASSVEPARAMLTRAEKFPGAAKFQIHLGDLKPIARARHRVQAFLRAVGGARRYENAIRRLRSASDAAAQLMQLREAEALGVVDQHDRRVRY